MLLQEVIGQNLKRVRLNLGFTQEEVASLSGVTEQFYGRVENGISIPSLNRLQKICKALGISIADATEDETDDRDSNLPSNAELDTNLMEVIRCLGRYEKQVMLQLGLALKDNAKERDADRSFFVE